MCLRGFSNRLKGAEVSLLYEDLILNEPNSMKYFPNSCRLLTPPKVYFFKLFSVFHSDQFAEILLKVIRNAKGENQVNDEVAFTLETAKIFYSINNNNSFPYLDFLKSKKAGKSVEGSNLHRKMRKKIHRRC